LPSLRVVSFSELQGDMKLGVVLSLPLGWLLLPALVWAAGTVPDRGQEEFFETRIRPLLVGRCLSCHGPAKQESRLRLDTREYVLRGGDGGPVVVLEDPPRSRLLDAVNYLGELQMPPDGKLTDAEVTALSQWVERGLPWPSTAMPLDDVTSRGRSHWAFQPVRKPPVPELRDTSWIDTPMDRFIWARLDGAGLRPSPEADRRTLIRRATFDLLGLPPTPDEVAAFTSDPSPDAYARLVDRLLASPRYGERWGRHWLDVARYADNKGYVFFEDAKYPWAYTYRDYVIEAFNADLPYDRFVLEQLAADQLDRVNQRALRAMGFLTLGGHFMNNTHDILDDRIDVVTRGLLGLTVTCARCHNHKYDPISQADYYGLYGVFRSSYEPTVPPLFETPAESETYQEFVAEMTKREQALLDFVTARHRDLVADARHRAAQYLRAAQAQRGQPPADDFMLLVDKGDLNPTMILRWQLYLEDPRQIHQRVWGPWRLLADVPPADFSARAQALLATRADFNPLVIDRLAAQPPQSMDELADLYGEVLVETNRQWAAHVEQASARSGEAPSSLPDFDAEELRQVLYGPDAPADAPLAMDWGFLSLFPDRPTQEEYKKLLKAVEEWSATGAGAPPRAMVLYDAATPYEPRIFQRGQPHRLGPYVPRKFLTLLEPDGRPYTRGSGRRELAEAIIAPNNPLTARVVVNRVWMHHFGRGLVGTPSDFGLRSEPPSHPELLDYLAAELIEQGWSLKELHRQILTSATYRQQSVDRAEGLQADTANELLWKMNRRRLEFEPLRDALLFVADHLDGAMYGPAVDLFGSATGPARRSVYGFIDRMDVPPLLTTFDFPNPIASSPQRVLTTVSLQALYLLNNPFCADCAQRLSERVTARDSVARIRELYGLTFAREPSLQEEAAAIEFLGEAPSADQWQRLAQGLLMTNEFMFVD